MKPYREPGHCDCGEPSPIDHARCDDCRLAIRVGERARMRAKRRAAGARVYSCSRCQTNGHTKRTCPAPAPIPDVPAELPALEDLGPLADDRRAA